jgi:hypothetical protein
MRRLISLLAVACAAVCVAGAALAASGPPRTTKQTVRNEIAAAIPGATRKQDADRLRDAVKKLDDSLGPNLWIDDYLLAAGARLDQEVLVIEAFRA